jgi:hypothetical protein
VHSDKKPDLPWGSPPLEGDDDGGAREIEVEGRGSRTWRVGRINDLQRTDESAAGNRAKGMHQRALFSRRTPEHRQRSPFFFVWALSA